MKDQIKQIVDAQLEKFNSLKDFNLLPLQSEFRLFQFSGLADGSILQKNFSDVDIRGKYIVLKSVKIVPYYAENSIDLYLTDATNAETIPANCRINRIFDVYDVGCALTVFFNGSLINMFPPEAIISAPGAAGNVPLDLDIDNLFYKHSVKLTSFDVKMRARVFQNIIPASGTLADPSVKVFIGCYLI